MNFVILNSLMYPVPRTHYLHVKKMAIGFSQAGYYIIETNTIESLVNLSENDIVYISSHFYVDLYYRFSRRFQLAFLKKILDKLKCKVLLWNFHTVSSDYFKDQKPNWLFLTESFYDDHFNDGNLGFYSKVKFYQLGYSSFIDDRLDYPVNSKFDYDFNYVGSPYNVSILDKIKADKAIKSFVRITPPIVNEADRINSFIFSKINLVFHSEPNKRKGIITERFAEAMSFGSIILHDNQRIFEHVPKLPGCLYVNDYNDIMDYFNYFNALPLADLKEIILKNREYWKSSPFSYRKQAHNMIELI